ncbi:MAG: TIGR00282 family metallophosphoesterase [Sphingomonadales bacterium]
MKIIFLGDIVGRAGRTVVEEQLPGLRDRLGIDFVIANGENAAAGFGITGKLCGQLFDAGVDVITTGNHIWDQREIMSYIAQEPRLLRPINFPPGTPGRGVCSYTDRRGRRIVVMNAMGRVFMDPLEDPFALVGAELDKARMGVGGVGGAAGGAVKAVFIDFHGEATSEKMAMGHFADGRASAVVGTHSHVPTADAQILPGGTGYQTDAGMCGDYNSVIGMDKAEPLQRFTRKISGGRFEAARGDATLCGFVVDTDDATGLARSVAPLRVGGRLSQTIPE